MTELYLGLMSGTSMDGVDAVLCEFEGERFVRVAASHTRRYAPSLRSDLLALQRGTRALPLASLARLDHGVAQAFAAAARGLLRGSSVPSGAVRAIGSHGQTVFHDPLHTRSSLQLGDPSLIAALTGITTVADFRRADVARGGHGAPLVPAFHHAVFASREEPRCVVNIGGIANVTVLPGLDPAAVRGFDTGPGNALMDEWMQARRGRAYDAGGRWGATGAVVPALLAALQRDPWFRKAPPKSTGRGDLHLEWARRRFRRLARLGPADVQRTFAELTAATIADAIRRYGAGARRVLVCGGGVRNGLLVRRLQALLSPAHVETTASHGLDPQHVEGAAFAWLAMRAERGLPGSLPAVTGAARAAVLGGLYRAS